MTKRSKLPSGWIEMPLKKVVSFRKGKRPAFLSKTEFNNSIPYLDVKAIERNIIFQYAEREGAIVSEGDELFVIWDGSRSGWIGEQKKGAIGSTIMALRPHVLVPGYLYAFLQTQFNFVNSQLKGVGIPHVDAEIFWDIKVPIAPLEQQYKIADKLKDFRALLHKSIERLKKIESLIHNFRLAILNHAFSGELTKDWRDQNNPRQLGKTLIEELIKNRVKKSDKVKLNYNRHASFDLPLPDGWEWTRLVNLADIAGGVTKGRDFKDKKTIKTPYLRVANVQDGYLDLKEIKKIEVLPTDVEKYKLINGDILFTEGGDRDKLGRGTIWNNEVKNCIYQNHIFRARVDSDYIVPEYISFYTKTEIAREYFFQNATQSVNLASINLTALSNVPIAVPSHVEQKEIVRRIERFLKTADKLEEKYLIIKSQIDQLPGLLLNKAFAGQLVGTSSVKSSSDLIDKINNEKERFEGEIKSKRFVRNKISSMKIDLIKIIDSKLGKKTFSFDQLREDIGLDYKDVSNELLKLVDSNNSGPILMHFNKKKNRIEFQRNEKLV